MPNHEDDGHDYLRQMSEYRDAGKATSQDNYKQQSRERLRKNIESKIRTTMIGALSHVEQVLGFLWGQGKPKHTLTDEELSNEVLKEELRTAILNLGNNQIRAANSELGQYDVEWKRHHYQLNGDPQTDNTRKGLRYGTDVRTNRKEDE